MIIINRVFDYCVRCILRFVRISAFKRAISKHNMLNYINVHTHTYMYIVYLRTFQIRADESSDDERLWGFNHESS